ncbi:MAG: response regulator [Rhodospirillaceae bacterium]|nr:response regulator [Rhodospirillaceae bacterium]
MAAATSDYLKPISFLVADDRAYMRRVIKNILETLGCKRIDEAHHGGEALSIMRSWAPDIVITEWLFGPMSGLELLKAVRAEKSNLRFTPIIMITSETRREKVILARNCGVTEYVAKPFNAKSLILRIREIIERPRPFIEVGGYFGPDRRRRTEVMSEGEERRGKGSPRPPVDPKASLTQDQIDRLVAGDSIHEH